MQAIVLHQVRDAAHSLHQERQERELQLRGKVGKSLLERLAVLRAVVRRQLHPGEDDPCSALLQLRDHPVEIGLHAIDGQHAEPVVSSERDDHKIRVPRRDDLDPPETHVGGVAADPFVDDVIGIAAFVELPLQEIGVAASRVSPETGGQTITESDNNPLSDRRGIAASRWSSRWLSGRFANRIRGIAPEQEQRNEDQNGTAH